MSIWTSGPRGLAGLHHQKPAETNYWPTKSTVSLPSATSESHNGVKEEGGLDATSPSLSVRDPLSLEVCIDFSFHCLLYQSRPALADWWGSPLANFLLGFSSRSSSILPHYIFLCPRFPSHNLYHLYTIAMQWTEKEWAEGGYNKDTVLCQCGELRPCWHNEIRLSGLAQENMTHILRYSFYFIPFNLCKLPPDSSHLMLFPNSARSLGSSYLITRCVDWAVLIKSSLLFI